MTKPIVSTTRPKRYFYAKDVNMNLSFDRLYDMAKNMLGADLDVGDILIADNHKGDKRKAMQVTKDGYMIYYARLKDKQKFQELAEHNGRLKNISRELM